jgi:hypothetical protein
VKRTLAAALTPAIERALRAFEPARSAADHLRLAARLGPAARDADPRDAEAFADSPRWLGAASELRPLDAPLVASPEFPRAARSVSIAARAGDQAWARAALEPLAGAIEAKRWFVAAGVRAGLAEALRALIASGVHESYACDVAERLLRHVEVKRADALAAPAISLETPSAREIEKLAWCHALLDCAASLRDLRFLNAALKTLDRAARVLERGAAPSALHALAYVSAVRRQERALSELGA